MTPFQERLRGSTPALLTTLDRDFAVDPDAMRRTTRRVLDNGSRGVVVLGTSGEFAGIDAQGGSSAVGVERGRLPVHWRRKMAMDRVGKDDSGHCARRGQGPVYRSLRLPGVTGISRHLRRHVRRVPDVPLRPVRQQVQAPEVRLLR